MDLRVQARETPASPACGAEDTCSCGPTTGAGAAPANPLATFSTGLLVGFGLTVIVVVGLVIFAEWLGLLDRLTSFIPWPVWLAAILASGYPIFRNVIRTTLRRKVTSHTLMTAGLIAAMLAGAWPAGIIIVFFMRLADWKTYWRYPGDAGVPPRFDFAGSENIKTITVLWPAPQRFSGDGISYIGYKGHVMLPLRIVPQDERKGVTIRLKLDYGICEKLCMLAEAKVELFLSGDASSREIALAAAEAQVPKPVAIGEGKALAIRSVRREVGTSPPRIVVDVVASTASRIDLFVEGPTPDWALPLPEPIAAAGGLYRFAFELAGVPADSKPEDTVLKFTAVADDQAVEVSTPLR